MNGQDERRDLHTVESAATYITAIGGWGRAFHALAEINVRHAVRARIAVALLAAVIARVARMRGRTRVRHVDAHEVGVHARAVRVGAAHAKVFRCAGGGLAQAAVRACRQRLCERPKTESMITHE